MFSPEERRIFGPFPNGRGQAAFADPVAVYRKLTLYTNGELNTLLEQYQQGDMGVAGSGYRLAEATISAFGLPPFDPATGQGTLEDDALDLLREFLDWRDQKKTKPVNSPISAPSTGQVGSGPLRPVRPGAFVAEQSGMAEDHPGFRFRPITPSG